MAKMTRQWLAALTRNTSNAGSDDRLEVTININATAPPNAFSTDIVIIDLSFRKPQGKGFFEELLDPDGHSRTFDSQALNNSSVRVGTRGSDAWGPQHVMLLGETDFGVVMPIAIETDIPSWFVLSTDYTEGRLSMPLRLVAAGESTMEINRLLLLVNTASGSNTDTNDDMQIQIASHDQLLFDDRIPRGTQDYLKTSWHFFDVLIPFTRAQVNRVTLRTLGDDWWLPAHFILFGVGTPAGELPTKAVTLVSLPSWVGSGLSTDPSEGRETVDLPLAW
jgi:hypothetical protein